MSGKPACAGAIHDPEGQLADRVAERADALRDLFSAFAFSLTPPTVDRLRSVLTGELGADLVEHPVGEQLIGLGRRKAVQAGAEGDAPHVLYSDVDHLLRWIDRDRAELESVLNRQPELDLLVIGRSAAGFAAEPKRLQETERLVNHVFALVTGHQWDLMFAVRRFSQRGAKEIMAASRVETLANDAEWPLLALKSGLATGYAEADGLYYRTLEEFSEVEDSLDGDPKEWLRRLEFALGHARVIVDFLEDAAPGRTEHK